MRKVKIFTNEVVPSWEPTDLENFLGGSEEAIVLFAKELVKLKFDVTVYHSSRIQGEKEYNGVKYEDRKNATCESDNIFITWKDNTPWVKSAKAATSIHWTADIEQSWGTNEQSKKLNINAIDAFVNISNYQKRKNVFVPHKKSHASPLGVDIESLDKNKVDKVSGTILYCSSPDRGLFQLLTDWKTIKKHYPRLTLKVAYGWNNFNFKNFQLRRFKNQITDLLKQDGIEYLGSLRRDEIEQEYWKAEYWILPLNNPDSELFCLNAVKAQYCECTPIVNKLGALKETVGDYIPYVNFIKGNDVVAHEKGIYSKAMAWRDVIEKYWISELFPSVQEPKDKEKLFNHFIYYSDVISAQKLNDKYSLGKDKFLQDNYPTIYKKYTATKEIQDSIAIDSDKKQAFKNLGDIERLMRFPRVRHIINEISDLKPGSLVLDYGCSAGEITVLMANQFPLLQFEGADISPVKLKIANEYIEKEQIKNVSYFECNDPLKIESDKYDAIICTETLEHILEYKELLEGLENATKKGGKIIITTPSGALESISFDNADLVREHIHHYEHEDILEIVGHKDNFKIIHIPTYPIKNIPVANYLWMWTKSKDNMMIGEINYERKFKEQSV